MFVSGNINVNGVIEDSSGSILLNTTGGEITLAKEVSAAGSLIIEAAQSIKPQTLSAGNGLSIISPVDVVIQGDVSVDSGLSSIRSTSCSIVTGITDGHGVTTGRSITTGGDLSVSAGSKILLGGNTASVGTVSLSSSSISPDLANPAIIDVLGSISAGDASNVSAITVSADGNINIKVLNPIGSVNVFTDVGDLLFQDDVEAAGSFIAFSVAGGFTQSKDTLIHAGEDLAINTQTGMRISSLSGDLSVVLAIRQTNLTDPTNIPTFARVNDATPFGSGGVKDFLSDAGTISFLTPVANVGAAELGQSFVQSAGAGIFYGLDTGKFFSDDIGESQILTTAPGDLSRDFAALFNVETGAIGVLAGDAFISQSLSIIASLDIAVNATGSAGQTSASSSSRSTAASQRDDDEETAEVDELVFIQLNNYEQTPNGILLPEDQQVAYDDEGNIYYMVSMRNDGGDYEKIPLYRVDLDLRSEASAVTQTFSNNYETLDHLAFGELK
ncbi:MAG: hypothetical protein ACI9CE_000530 [Flavobacterium sp.]